MKRSDLFDVLVAILLTLLVAGMHPRRAHGQQAVIWVDALCGADPVTRHLHERLDQYARSHGWERRPVPGGCQWVGERMAPQLRESALTRNAELVGAAVRSRPSGATAVLLANSMVVSRIQDPRPAVLNSDLVGRDVYLFATDPSVLCARTATPLRVGYLRGTARRAEIVGTLAYESRRPVSEIDARDVPALADFRELLGVQGDKGFDVAAIVVDDIGGTYREFKDRVLDPRNGAVREVALCSPSPAAPAARFEKRLEGSVAYLRVVGRRPGAPASDLSAIALLRPGQEPEVAQPKNWIGRLTEALFAVVESAEMHVRLSDFQDFPVLLAAGPSESDLAKDSQLKQVLSDAYFEGMYDSLAGGLNPCKERSDILFGAYLLSSYLDDTASAYKGCALEAYYRLMSTMPRRPETAKRNADVLMARPELAACLSQAAVSPPAPAGAAGQAVSCSPTEKEKLEARDYGPHYAYYREGLRAIATGLAASGPAKERSLRLAETCLVQALHISQRRSCDDFSQGLFVVPYEPSLPLGMIKLSGGK